MRRTESDAVWAPEETADVGVVSARGTTEPPDGSGLLKPIGAAIATRLPGRVHYTELDYPASFDFAHSSNRGVAALVELLNAAAVGRPDRRHVLLGYSQGAHVVGDALLLPARRSVGRDAEALTPAASARIAAVLLYGDPRFTRGEPFNRGDFDPARQGMTPRPRGALDAYADRLRDFCARGDFVCQAGGGGWPGHVAYFSNSMPAEGVRFALRRLQEPAGERERGAVERECTENNS